MPFANGTKAQDESTAILRRASLVGVPYDARIEQGRRLERVLVEKIRTDQAALRLIQFGMWFERLFHLCGAHLKDIEQIPVPAFEILEHITQLLRSNIGTELKNPANDMVGPDFVGRVKVSGFSRRFEGSDDDPGRIRAQIQVLAVQKSGLRQSGPLGSCAVRSGDLRRCVPMWMRVSFVLSR